jgi:hypothetical protein
MQRVSMLILVFSVIGFQSCGDEKEKKLLNTDQQSTIQDSLHKSLPNDVDSIFPIKKVGAIAPKFKLKIDSHAEEFDPNTTIYLETGEGQVEVAAISGEGALINHDEYAEMNIPKQAIQACGAWWAGAGEYFYVIKNASGGFEVYRGWLDEYQSKKDYHWKKIDLNLH